MVSETQVMQAPASEAPGAPTRIVAGAEASGERVDRFLADAIGTMSRSRVKSLIIAGQAQRDGTTLTEPAEAVRAGAVYTLAVPPPASARPLPQAIPFTILYEDPDLIVLDKPAGLVVHPAPGNEDGTLVNALLAHCGGDLPGIGGERRPGIVHRLDKDTSGVMVVAKTQEAMTALSAAFATRDLDRAYLALAWGVPAAPRGEIEGAIGATGSTASGWRCGCRAARRPSPATRPCVPGMAGPRCWNAGWPPGGPIKSAFTSPPVAIRSSATRSICAASRKPPG